MSLMLLRWSRVLMVGALLAVGPVVQAQDENDSVLSLDQEFALLAEGVPGFGGLYVDEKGTTHVYLQDLSRAPEVRNLAERVEVHQGRYDFRDLFAWKGEMRGLLSRPGTLSLDIDERRNRLVVEVERKALDAFKAELPRFLGTSRVPPEAVIVEAAEPTVRFELLTDRFRPVPGGVQIQSGAGTCTLGVNATRLGVRGFITASHCTLTQGGVEGTVFSQNVVHLGNLVGTEIADPPLFIGGNCPFGRRCRFSDAAFVDYIGDGSPSAGGEIANGLLCGVAGVAGTLQVNPGAPRIPVVSFMAGSPPSGAAVWKVGRTTGCTIGAQQSTCVDSNVSGTNITMLCQNRVSAASLGGDSGSPVFLNQGGEATIAGILWGGNGSTYAYSPWIFVQSELGGVLPELD